MPDYSKNTLEAVQAFLDSRSKRACPDFQLPKHLRDKHFMDIASDGTEILMRRGSNEPV